MINKLLFTSIILLAFIVRFYNLGSYPALNADEAALGYNAYSLLMTGRDEHGNQWPIHFQSFNDYKPGLYVYLLMPFVALFGLNEWAVRLPGALAGVLTVFVIYKLTRLIMRGSYLISDGEKPTTNYLIPTTASFLLAINPWHIHFSRGAWEVNVATFFIISGLWLFLKFLNTTVIASKKEDHSYTNSYLTLSFLAFIFSLYTYHAARVVVPLLGIGIIAIYFRDLVSRWKFFVTPLTLSFILLVPLAVDLLGPAGISRAAGVGLFADTGPLSRIEEQRGEHADFSQIGTKIVHNKIVNYGLAFVQNWADHYHGEFLFLSGDEIQRSRVPETGQMHIFELVTIVFGLWYVTSKIFNSSSFSISRVAKQFSIFENESPYHDIDRRHWLLIIWWLFIAPAAAALTFQSPHALRAQNMVIPLTIVSAFGLYTIVQFAKLKTRTVSGIIFMLIVFVILVSFSRYLHMYYLHMSKEYPFSSQYGIKELVGYVSENINRYEKVIVTDKYDQPYILFLFYMKYDPTQFQSEHRLSPKDSYGFSTVRSFGKLNFEPITPRTIPENPRSLIIGADEDILPESNIVQKIYGDNGYLYFEAVAN